MDPRLFNPSSQALSTRADRPVEQDQLPENVRLPPLKLDPYAPSPARHSPPNLPHIQSLRPSSQYGQDFIFTGRSLILNEILISTIQQHQSSNFLLWARRFYKTFPACRFYFYELDSTTRQELLYDISRLGGRVEENYTDLVTHVLFLPPPLDPKPNQSLSSLVPVKEERHTPRLFPPSPNYTPYHNQLTTLLPNSGHLDRLTPPRKIEQQEPHPNSYRGITNDFNPPRDEAKNWYYDNYQREHSKPKAMIVPPRSYQSASPFPKLSNFALSGFSKVQHRRSEIHFFRYPYILSEDVTGMYRPAVAAEYPPSKEADDVIWPKLWPVSASRCPFIRIPPRHKAGGLTEKRPGDNSPGFRTKMPKNSQNRHHLYSGTGSGLTSRDLEHQRKRSILNDHNSSKVGAQRLAALPNSFLHLEKRGNTPKSLPPPTRPIRTKSSAPAAVANTKKPGYCENCRSKFPDIEEHVMSPTHRAFAMKETNFQSLDCLLRRLNRIYKPTPALAPTPTATNPSSSSPHHWYGKSARDYESEATSNPNQTYSFDLAGSDSRSIFPKPLSDQSALDSHLGGAVLDQF
ncbi:Cdc7p-Dbf4p kinase complex regulatory subunit [Entomophthora muscae]|uniref:Cdc7p-Dbf4p kinase complex regulatory subunit n=1 Tax=Entomophthora muscae TaxID=34485 RepID=A0ACC2RL49_9FUNG|nr:Cdc7p-Dbf4p kinase complex regulatory subunit [Entomophthora muscae]